MLKISNKVSIPLTTAVHLRFDIPRSSLPAFYKSRLLRLSDRRITKDGMIVIKAQRHRSQEQNREEALERLRSLVRSVAATLPRRKPTRPTKSARQKRMDKKTRRGRIKQLRKKVSY